MKTIFLTILLCIVSVQISNAEWAQVTNGMGNRFVYSLATGGNNIYAGTNTYGVYLSTDNGNNWTQTSLNNQSIYSLAVNGNYIFAGTTLSTNGVYLSTNNGGNWTQTSLNNRAVFSLAVNGNYIFAGTGADNGVYFSTNNGTSWSQTSLNNRSVYSLAINGNNILAGTYFNGLYSSTNNGASWTQSSLNNKTPYALAINGNNIFAGVGYSGSGSGVYLSTDNTITWTQTSLNDDDVLAMSVSGNNIFTGANFGVYVSNDNGANWAQRNEGLSNHDVRAFCKINNFLFAGTGGGGVSRRSLSELTGIKPVSNEVPGIFSLSQNYPNPFNPETRINFSIPKTHYTILTIYDALGKEVETLVNKLLNAGTYETVWTAEKFSSGIYYFKLTSDKFTSTHKMVLLK